MSGYHSLTRTDALRILPPGRAEKVLEVGCGTGETLAYMKRNGLARHVTGIEREPACAAQVNPQVDIYYTADAETFFFHEKYDGVLLLDVLEHLVEPFALLKKLAFCLNPGGWLLVSIPNIRNLYILKDLIFKGKWEYTESGILDKGHLRFFTHASFSRAATHTVPKLHLERYASNDMRISPPWSWLVSFLPSFKELGVCQHLYLFSYQGGK